MKDITRIKPSDLAKVDQSKAYTHAFMNIENIPMFNEFDIWKKYNNEPIKNIIFIK